MNPGADLLASQTSVVLFTLDSLGNFTFLNPAAERLCARSESELLGKPFTTVLDPYSHAKAALMLARTFTDGSVSDWELDHAQLAGLPVLVGYTTSVLRDETGAPIGLAAVGKDLTAKLELTAQLAASNQQLEGALLQLEKAHAQLQAAQAQLVQSEKMRSLGQLVAGVAHEINNPAGYVANNLADLARLAPAMHTLFEAYLPLKAGAGPEQLAVIRAAETAAGTDFLWQDLPDLVRESREGIERIRRIVLALQSFARQGGAAFVPADVNLGLRSVLQLIRSQCRDRITVTDELGELPRIPCDPGELNQVFMNLLLNALQAINEEGHITVSSRVEGETVVVAIRDDGTGMSPETLARLGEPFFTTKPIGAGTGLGLAVSFGIVERHHGRIRFESTVGQGTTAVVAIPIDGPDGA